MKERPILFSDEMVRAILDGKKTQTRRVATMRHLYRIHNEKGSTRDEMRAARSAPASIPDGTLLKSLLPFCPYGGVGDRLWVKECFQIEQTTNEDDDAYQDGDVDLVRYTWVHYRATPHVGIRIEPDFARMRYLHESTPASETRIKKWRPSIFMNREYSRFTLPIVGIRFQRLQNISRADALAEGISDAASWPTKAYAALWERINGEGSWAANPWVWVLEFTVEERRG